MSVNVKMTAIADAIRSKTGKTAPLSLDGMAVEIDNMAVTAKLTGLTIHRPPTKTQYDDGETFDRTGMEVHAAYDDGHFLDVAAVASYEPDRPLTAGDTEITATYIESGISKSATQPITVRYLTGISVSKNPTKMDYIAGELFDPTGMEITGAFSIGPSAPVTGYTCEPSGPLTVADTQITVSYTWGSQTKSTALSVNVTELDPAFENNSWETIGRAADAGMASNFWSVGNEKTISLNGTNYTVQIVGINHDNLHADDPKYNTAYNGGTNKAALSLMMKECLATTYRMHSSDVNNWKNSEMRNTTLPARLPELPELLRNNIRTVGKRTARDGNISIIVTTADKLWLLSEVEVWGANKTSKPGEGTQYAFYAAGNSRVKNRNGTSAWWWLRSPYSGNSVSFLFVSSDGAIGSNSASDPVCGVAFGFCM